MTCLVMIRFARTLLLAALASLVLSLPAFAQPKAPTPLRPGAPAAKSAPVQNDEDEDDDSDDSDDEDTTPSQRNMPQVRRPVPTRPLAQPQSPQRTAPSAPTAMRPARPAGNGQKPVKPTNQVGDDNFPALEDLTATRERPLFSTTRRPPEVEEPEEPEAEPITEGASMPFELVGIVVSADVSAAIFRNTESKEETRVLKGEKIGNWNIEEITDRAVVLRGKDKRVRMRLFNEANSPGVQVGKIQGTDEVPDPEPPKADQDDEVDEDIAPSSSPEVRPATAQPKPPPSLRKPTQRPRRGARPGRANQSARPGSTEPR